VQLTRRGARLVVAVVIALGSAHVASAQDTRVVYAPMTFKAEAGPLRTTACLQLTERVYPTTRWWESADGHTAGPDRAFKAVIAAIKQKDRASLVKLTSPDQARDTARFDQQAGAFFQQFDSIRLIAVPRAYEFDGLVVFFGTFQSATQTAVVPLVFAQQGADSFGFLPSRTDKLTFLLVNDWFIPSTGAPADSPSYCSVAEVKRATHRVALVPVSWRPSVLLLTGAPIDAPGPLAARATQVKSTVTQMKTALLAVEPTEFFAFLTPEGAGRLRGWFASAAQAERDGYRKALLEHEPFFLFDQGPLVVVYTKSAAGDVQVMYFTAGRDERLLWTNSSHITVSDRVFKQGPLLAAASSTIPFSSLVIK
jgi:hypothetical protein